MMGYIKELCSLKTLHTQGRKTEVMLDDEHGKHLSLNIVFTDAAGKDNVQFYALSDTEALALAQALIQGVMNRTEEKAG